MTEIETRMVEYMRPLFGEFADSALEQQKAKLGLPERPEASEYMRLVEGIRAMCTQIAGASVAEKVYAGLMKIVTEAA